MRPMSSASTQSARALRHAVPGAGPDAEAWAAELMAANINPRTGLATDYLNHFNEAIMLLEMIPDMPECATDFLEWKPLTYAEHFHASHLRGRDLAIAAYDAADPTIRMEFDTIVSTITSILLALHEAMGKVTQDKTRIELARHAAGWLKPMVMAAGGIINGRECESDVDYIMTH
jgi:hypothetical protein